MIQLRVNGIYKLPNDQRLVVALSIGGGEFFLYDYEFGSRLPPRFKINSLGQVINWFNDFPIWTTEDLIDTGGTL